MAQSSYLKHLRVLFTLICSLSLLSYGSWLVYTQFIQHQVTKPMLAQARQAKIDFEAILFRDPTGAGASEDISPNDEDKLALALSLTTADVAFSNLSAMDLLNVQEVISAAFSAVKFTQPQALIALQERLIETAMQLNLAPQQIKFLRSAQAVDFLTFRAKRAWFNQEVEKRYHELHSLDGLLAEFPEARGQLYQEATKLIIDRDLIIFNTAKALASAESRLVTEQDIANARVQWQASLSTRK
ncbi:hypothetical protein N8985_01265 [Glaciecola sp.]|nr:hypothetical protein [Glaciecola sp.]